MATASAATAYPLEQETSILLAAIAECEGQKTMDALSKVYDTTLVLRRRMWTLYGAAEGVPNREELEPVVYAFHKALESTLEVQPQLEEYERIEFYDLLMRAIWRHAQLLMEGNREAATRAFLSVTYCGTSLSEILHREKQAKTAKADSPIVVQE